MIKSKVLIETSNMKLEREQGISHTLFKVYRKRNRWGIIGLILNGKWDLIHSTFKYQEAHDYYLENI